MSYPLYAKDLKPMPLNATSVQVEIPESAWRETGQGVAGDPADRLAAAIMLNGAPFWAEAWRLAETEEQGPRARQLDEDFAAIGQAFAPGGPFVSVTIRGAQYVVFIFPAED